MLAMAYSGNTFCLYFVINMCKHFEKNSCCFKIIGAIVPIIYARQWSSISEVKVNVIDVFMTYELLAYLSVRATQIGMKACEIPVRRAYPKAGKTPTKISFFKGNSELMKILLKNVRGAYNPRQDGNYK